MGRQSNKFFGSLPALLAVAVVLVALAGCGSDEETPPEPADWTFTAVGGAGPGNLIVLGFDFGNDEPLVLQSVGETWEVERLDVSILVDEYRRIFGGDKNPMFRLWALDGPAGDMYAAGDHGVVYRFDGGTWIEAFHDFQAAQWGGVWATPDEVKVVGSLGAILHGDTDGFAVDWPMAPGIAPNLYGVWGSAPDNIWAVGDAVLRYDGGNWLEATNPGNGRWAAIDGRDEADIWMGGVDGYIMFFNGLTWEESHRHEAGNISDLACLPGGEVVALATRPGATDILIRGNDGLWYVDTTINGAILDGVWGSAVDDIYAVGDADRRGLLYHRDGAGWALVDVDPLALEFAATNGSSRP